MRLIRILGVMIGRWLGVTIISILVDCGAVNSNVTGIIRRWNLPFCRKVQKKPCPHV